MAKSRAFLFDVDGTLVLSDDPNSGTGGARAPEGAVEVLQTLRTQGQRFAGFTNGTGHVPGAVAARLRREGLDVQDSELLTPASVAAEHIRNEYSGEPVLAFGTA